MTKTPILQRLATGIHTAKRLTVLVWIVSLLLFVIAVTSAWQIKQTQTRSEEIHSRNVASIRAAVELELHIQELRHLLDQFLVLNELTGVETAQPPHLRSIETRRATINRWLNEAEATANTIEELNAIDQVRQGLSRFYAAIESIPDAPVTGDQAVLQVRQAEAVLENELLGAARAYLSLDEALLEQTNAEAARQSDRLVLVLLGLGIFGAIAALLAGYSLARMISQSLIQIRIPMQDVAGKLSEVAGDVIVSSRFDLADLGPMLQQVSAQVTTVLEHLHQRHQEILHADQLSSVGQLAAGIAHEIRNPLMSMKLLVQSARRQEQHALDELDLKILDEEIRRLEVLLDDFLDFARPKPLEKRIVDVRDLAESVVAFLQPQADVRSVTLECDVPSLPVQLPVDAPRIRQVLVNLLLNGIQVTPRSGTVRLMLKSPDDSDRGACEIFIRDDGPGIGPELAERVFEPFFSTKETGLGLGLAVSQRIIRSHGGELSLESANGRGAGFIISLPLETLEVAAR